MKDAIMKDLETSTKIPKFKKEEILKGKLQKNLKEIVLYEQIIQNED